MAKLKDLCCWHTGRKGFPTFAVLLLVLGILWLLSDLNVIVVNIPWWPVILIVIASGWIIDHFLKK